MQYNWVCNNSHLPTIAQSIFFCGSIVGGLLFGWIADRYGRIPSLMAANILGAAAGITTAFTTDFWSFTVCRFFVGFAFDNCFTLMYILGNRGDVLKLNCRDPQYYFDSFRSIGVCRTAISYIYRKYVNCSVLRFGSMYDSVDSFVCERLETFIHLHFRSIAVSIFNALGGARICEVFYFSDFLNFSHII